MTNTAPRTLPQGHWIIKVGSNILLSESSAVDRLTFASLVRGVDALIAKGNQVTLVSSGAVALGRQSLTQGERPLKRDVATLQALAALGQPHLMRLWSQEFKHYGHNVAQLLFSREDLGDRGRYLNARRALERLRQLGVIPIINENDTVATEELRFGDNDRLAAMACGLVGADLLVILSDVEGVLDRDSSGALGDRIKQIGAEDPRLDDVAGGSDSGVGTGGMTTKVGAARVAARFGTPTCIAPGRMIGVLESLLRGDDVGTLLVPQEQGDHMIGKRVWLGAGAKPQGRVVCDLGARDAVVHKGASLLPRGVIKVTGEFGEGAVVELVVEGESSFALGVINYSAAAARRLCGLQADQIEAMLGYKISDALVHRDNLVVLT